MAQFIFDSVDEVRAFVKEHLKGSPRRGGKDDTGEDIGTVNQAPAPIQPTTAQQGFAPVSQHIAPAASPFGNSGTAPPDVHPLVGRIVAKIVEAEEAGKPTEGIRDWFRTQIGPDATNADLAAIKTVHLPRMAPAGLETIVKLIRA